MNQRWVVILGCLGFGGVLMGCGSTLEEPEGVTARASIFAESPSPWVCGQDGSCDEGETHETCPLDCDGPDPFCGDGRCNGTESNQSCPQDCDAPAPFCGDGLCAGSETHQTYPAACDGPVSGVCGNDGVCDEGETHETCPFDCDGPL
ncbi:tenascin-X [Myxococcus stipitatus]|uniref:tenascin-X n=1 Tax=Myxococcus stipitatus TaxID=83455 RepID=UPI0030D4C5D9